MQKTIEIIRDYATNTESLLGTGIMLNGAWGSGKTYFVKNVLIPDLGEGKCAYVSLNGVKSADEVTDRILLSIMGSDAGTEKKLWASFYKFAKRTDWGAKANIARDFVLVSGGFLKDLIISRNIKNRLLIVDDLERVSNELSIEEVLGYFNSYFIEKHGQRVLFVCNEDEIKNQDDYKKIREKTISWTIKYAPKFEDCFGSIIGALSPNHCKLFLDDRENKATILELFKTAKIANLRTVIKATEIFNRIMGDKDESIDNDIALRLFRMVTMLVNETSLGKLNIDSMECIHTLKHYVYFQRKPQIDSNDYQKSVYRMLEYYFEGKIHQWLYLESVHKYISGYDYDKGKIWDDIKKLRTPANKALNQFEGRYRLDSEDEVQQTIIGLRDHILNDGYDSSTLHIIYLHLQHSDMSMLDQTNISQLEELIVAKVEQQIKECNSIEDFMDSFYHIKSRQELDGKFTERIKPVYDEKMIKLRKADMIQLLEFPNPTIIEETIKSGSFFIEIEELELDEYFYKMSSSELDEFRIALGAVEDIGTNMTDLNQKELDSIRTFIDGFKKHMSEEPWKREVQKRFILSLESFRDGIIIDYIERQKNPYSEDGSDSPSGFGPDEPPDIP